MADLINNALAKTRQQTSTTRNTISEATALATSKQQALITNAENLLNDSLNKLPNIDDKILIARQKEAEFFEKKKQAEELQLQIEEKADEIRRVGLKKLVRQILPFPPKLPALDPKVLAVAALFEKRKLLRKLRKKITELNQVRAAKINRYPLRNLNKQSKLGIPKVPQIPKISNLPLPQIPKMQSVQIPKNLRSGIVSL